MTRLLTALGLAAGAVAALLLWASSRDLREPWRWPAIPTPEPDDDIQPPDPVTLAKGGPMPASTRLVLRNESGCEYLEPLTAADRSYLEATTLAAIRRSAQSSDAPTGGM